MKYLIYNKDLKKTTDFDCVKIAPKTKAFHESFNDYNETSLVSLNNLASKLHVKNIFVKDESQRFGLNAFKVLGGSYAIARTLADLVNDDIELTADYLTSSVLKAKVGEQTIITATDGNHGRGIAWIAKELELPAKIFMPKGTKQERIDHIEKLGGEVVVTDMTFDQTAEYAYNLSKEKKWIMAQDTTFAGYVTFPRYCMEGYATMSLETKEQLEDYKQQPTHLFIQAGAGSLAGSVVDFFANCYEGNRPKVIVVEAQNCGTYFETASKNDGNIYNVEGNLKTFMAGLSVGSASTIGWEILRAYTDAFIVVDDQITANAMRVLGAPLADDIRVISGESGAAGFAAFLEMMINPKYTDLRKALELDENSNVLCFNTEGDTDQQSYENVVWYGDNGYVGQE